MIRAQGIYKSFGEIKVLKGLDISVDRGAIVSIIGASGAGKSTLLQILGTLEKPTLQQGIITRIEIDGIEISYLTGKSLSCFRNQHIGFIFQFHHLLPEFTALENVCLPGFIGRRDTKTVKKKALELLNYLKLSHRIEHKPAALSGGEQQRVAIARALINKPKVIFADEPSGNLDSENAKELHELFFSLRELFRQTFVIITHNIELADMADRKMEMKNGVLVSSFL
ncbi:MAG: ABC transporter ATP-binding protein [Flavobacteriales bacterium AspAUS03]